jgi:hypothetical protein
VSEKFNKLAREMRVGTVISLEILRGISEDDFHDLIVNYVSCRESQPVSEKSLIKFPDAIKYIYSTYMADIDILCGGLEQYFTNTGFIYVDDAILGYKYLGLLNVSELLERAKTAKHTRDWAQASIIEKEFFELNLDFNLIRYKYFEENIDGFIPEPDSYYDW